MPLPPSDQQHPNDGATHQSVNDAPWWFRDLPSPVRMFINLGFAGLVAVLFFMDSRDRAQTVRDLQSEQIRQNQEDRKMFRDELRNQQQELHHAVKVMENAALNNHTALLDNQRVIIQAIQQLNTSIANNKKP